MTRTHTISISSIYAVSCSTEISWVDVWHCVARCVYFLGQRKHTTTLNRDVHTHTHRWVRGYAHDLQVCQDGVCLCTLDKERQLESEHRMAGWIIRRRSASLSISHDMSLKSWVVGRDQRSCSRLVKSWFSLCVCSTRNSRDSVPKSGTPNNWIWPLNLKCCIRLLS